MNEKKLKALLTRFEKCSILYAKQNTESRKSELEKYRDAIVEGFRGVGMEE